MIPSPIKETSARIMIVDRSEVARSILSHILQKEMQNIYIVTCGSAEEALEYLNREKFDLITTALLLPGLDGLDLCHEIRKSDKQHLTPVIVVSSDADTRLLREGFSAGVTDYFNKSLGYRRLVEFIKDIIQRHAGLVGKVLYVEDSPSTATNTKMLMQNHGLQITHLSSAEEALALLEGADPQDDNNFDVVFTDFFLSGQMTGGDLLYAIRTQLHKSRQELPVLVVTVQDNEDCQADIFHAGANDFITKPVIEEVLMARIKSLLLIKHQYNVLQRYSKDMFQLATTDALTGTKNKEYLFSDGPDFIQKHTNICLMMVDVDHLEQINEEHGHLIGDHILHIVGNFLTTRFQDKLAVVARFGGGKKFTLIIANIAQQKTITLAESLRQELQSLRPEGIAITATIGLTWQNNGDRHTLNTLIANADAALHQAHEHGYNLTKSYFN
ncbi:response regulator [Candidatus Venteria ishoeyi]|uniref:response regulator n=1 Tax=Candidatus Venteria ishoeyi TaxID=1899563 RepID=UPI0025A5BE20|nr:response regulator [Candidatus Venteria ishoeyi]MDM8546835.1 response regulator [Candidatus Venteria ishoeyi]